MKGFFNSFKKAAAGIITGSNYSQETNQFFVINSQETNYEKER